MMITWMDLAEEQEMLARAWTMRGGQMSAARLQRAMRGDAEDAAAQARAYREAQEAGALLNPSLAFFLAVAPVNHPDERTEIPQ